MSREEALIKAKLIVDMMIRDQNIVLEDIKVFNGFANTYTKTRLEQYSDAIREIADWLVGESNG